MGCSVNGTGTEGKCAVRSNCCCSWRVLVANCARIAGLAQTFEGVSRVAETFAESAVPFAVATPGRALGIQCLADGVPLAGNGIELVAERLLCRIGFGPSVLALAEQVGVPEQDLADGLTAAEGDARLSSVLCKVPGIYQGTAPRGLP